MKTCKDCLHYEVCNPDIKITVEMFRDVTGVESCKYFTESSEWVHLPCKVNDLYSLEAVFKKWDKNKYAIVRYDCQKNKPLRIVSYVIKGKDLIRGKDLLLYEYLPSMNFSVVKNGFNSYKEASEALERMKENERNII